MKKNFYTSSPNLILYPSLYFFILIVFQIISHPEYTKAYIVALCISIPVLIFHKNFLKSNMKDFISLALGSDQEKKLVIKKFRPIFIAYFLLAVLHLVLRLPIAYTALAVAFILLPEHIEQYQTIQKETGNEGYKYNLKKHLFLAVASFFFILLILANVK